MNKTYQVGHTYTTFEGLKHVGDYTHAGFVKVMRFENATLRFVRKEGEDGYLWMLSEIFNPKLTRQPIAVEIPQKRRDCIERLVDVIERLVR